LCSIRRPDTDVNSAVEFRSYFGFINGCAAGSSINSVTHHSFVEFGVEIFAEGEYCQLPGGVIERSGFGVHTTADGSVFRGTWSNDRLNGSGNIQFATGASYEGGLVDNCFNGQGRYTWPNGSYFEGDFVKNKCVFFLC
jgi:hypothetical protein